MCGIVFALTSDPNEAFIHAASELQHHRGPDGAGLHFERLGCRHLGYGHQRLALLDLSDRGLQPMHSASGRYTILFNGEIYNFRELIAAHGLTDLNSGTDTEVALRVIERVGLDAACRAFNGMWAIVLRDRETGLVSLARDRIGKKPLNILHRGGDLYVASEVKTFFALPDFTPTPNPEVTARYLGQILQNADEQSWVEGINALPAASIGDIRITAPADGIVNLRRYWKPSLDGADPSIPDAEHLTTLRDLVTDATRLRLKADVPVGIALSGGLDSSILASVAAGAQEGEVARCRLLSVVHPGHADDESAFVDLMATHLGADVSRVSLDLADGGADATLALITRCNHMNDGPLSSFSAVLFYKMMEQARAQGITAILTGQGADEVFCGYRKFPVLEAKSRAASGHLLSSARFMAGFIGNGTLFGQFSFSEAKRYLGMRNGSIMGPAAEAAFVPFGLSDVGKGISARQLSDIEQLSVPHLCHYEDRMSMAMSREVRSPFLDYRVVEHGLGLPVHLKMRHGWTKFALRKSFEDRLPAQIAWRKDKKGFVSPEATWLRENLRARVLELMGDPANPAYQLGLVDREAYLKLFTAFCNHDARVWFKDVFAPLTLSLWLADWQARAASSRASAAVPEPTFGTYAHA